MSTKRTSAAQLRAVRKYQLAHTKQYTFKLHKTYDADLVELLEGADSKSGLIKAALKAYKAQSDTVNE